MPKHALRLAAVVLAVFVGACSSSGSPADDPDVEGLRTLSQVIASTTEAGDAEVAVKVRVDMPPDFDDGVPRRDFSGKGVLDQENQIAEVAYQLASVPNSAGYFGQADGTTAVFYTEDAFVLSFPLLETALGPSYDWFRYELDDFSDPRLRELGIGQLREIGIADPRFGLALLAGGPKELPEAAPSADGGSEAYEFESNLAVSAAAAVEDQQLAFSALEELGLEKVDVKLTLDEERRVETMLYRLSYPPAPGSAPVKLKVETSFSSYGLESDVSLPSQKLIADYEDYVLR